MEQGERDGRMDGDGIRIIPRSPHQQGAGYRIEEIYDEGKTGGREGGREIGRLRVEAGGREETDRQG